MVKRKKEELEEDEDEEVEVEIEGVSGSEEGCRTLARLPVLLSHLFKT